MSSILILSVPGIVYCSPEAQDDDDNNDSDESDKEGAKNFDVEGESSLEEARPFLPLPPSLDPPVFRRFPGLNSRNADLPMVPEALIRTARGRLSLLCL